MRVSWNAGLMNSSPVPEWERTRKCTQNQNMYTIAGTTMRPKALAKKCLVTCF